MEKRTRKYFRAKIRRIPPYYPINSDYYFEEDVWAFSEGEAINKITKQYQKCYGSCKVSEITEITKLNFRGDKKVMMIIGRKK